MRQPKYKLIQVADLDKFTVHAYVPYYKYVRVAEPDYFVDIETGENIGPILSLVIFPDGTKELPHHRLFCTALNKFFDVTLDMVPDVED